MYFLLPSMYFVCEVLMCNVLNSGLFKGHCFGNGIKASWAHRIYTSRCLWQVEFQEGPPWPLHHSSVYAQYNLLFLRVWTSQMVLTVKNPPPMQETCVWSPDQEDSLEEELATRSSILALKILWTEEPGALRVGHEWVTEHSDSEWDYGLIKLS